MDIAAYGQTSYFIDWQVPKNFPPGTNYALKITTATGVITSPNNISVTSASFQPCNAPSYYPPTISNVTAVNIYKPSMLENVVLFSKSQSVYTSWSYPYGTWDASQNSINTPISLEILQVKEFTSPGSEAQITAVLGTGTTNDTRGNGIVELNDVKRIGPAIFRVNFTRSGDQTAYSFVSEVFLITDYYNPNKCPLTPIDLPASPTPKPSPSPSVSGSEKTLHMRFAKREDNYNDQNACIPPYYPTTRSNVTALRLNAPIAMDVYSKYTFADSVYCRWQYKYGPWDRGSGLNAPATLEILLVKEYTHPGANAQIISVFASGFADNLLIGEKSSSTFASSTGYLPVGAAVCRLNVTHVGDNTVYSFVSDVFFISEDINKCPLSAYQAQMPGSTTSPSPKSSKGYKINVLNGLFAAMVSMISFLPVFVFKEKVFSKIPDPKPPVAAQLILAQISSIDKNIPVPDDEGLGEIEKAIASARSSDVDEAHWKKTKVEDGSQSPSGWQFRGTKVSAKVMNPTFSLSRYSLEPDTELGCVEVLVIIPTDTIVYAAEQSRKRERIASPTPTEEDIFEFQADAQRTIGKII
ncbi:hypothetical protein HK098_003435 [Nowakowskiella sp. JEL0407]|nr:hypothetical protein HK098_003435 [Nowakowskiella sp. JEL0407]